MYYIEIVIVIVLYNKNILSAIKRKSCGARHKFFRVTNVFAFWVLILHPINFLYFICNFWTFEPQARSTYFILNRTMPCTVLWWLLLWNKIHMIQIIIWCNKSSLQFWRLAYLNESKKNPPNFSWPGDYINRKNLG